MYGIGYFHVIVNRRAPPGVCVCVCVVLVNNLGKGGSDYSNKDKEVITPIRTEGVGGRVRVWVD